MSLQDISNPPLNAICGEFNTLRIRHRCRKEFRYIKSAKRREGNLTLFITHRKSMHLKEISATKQAGGKGETEKDNQSAVQKKRTRTTRQPSLDAGAQFTCFTGTEGQILTQLRQTLLAADAFDLRENRIGPAGADSLAGVLGQCASMAHLDLCDNRIETGGAESLARVLGQCTSLAHLHLCENNIGADGAESLAGVLGQCASLAHLYLSSNSIGQDGTESLAGVLAQCASLTHLDLKNNEIGTVGKGRLGASWRPRSE
jgi:hypothetical protein